MNVSIYSEGSPFIITSSVRIQLSVCFPLSRHERQNHPSNHNISHQMLTEENWNLVYKRFKYCEVWNMRNANVCIF